LNESGDLALSSSIYRKLTNLELGSNVDPLQLGRGWENADTKFISSSEITELLSPPMMDAFLIGSLMPWTRFVKMLSCATLGEDQAIGNVCADIQVPSLVRKWKVSKCLMSCRMESKLKALASFSVDFRICSNLLSRTMWLQRTPELPAVRGLFGKAGMLPVWSSIILCSTLLL
jgi:hypothetical protein